MERVQHRFTRMIEGFSSLPYAERLLRLGLWTLEERKNRRDLIEVFKTFNGDTEISDLRSFEIRFEFESDVPIGK